MRGETRKEEKGTGDKKSFGNELRKGEVVRWKHEKGENEEK